LIGAIVAAVLRVERGNPQIANAPGCGEVRREIGRAVIWMGNVIAQREKGPGVHPVSAQIPEDRRAESKRVGLVKKRADVRDGILVVIEHPILLALAVEQAREGQVAPWTVTGGEFVDVRRANEL